jgi:hypothetical protein
VEQETNQFLKKKVYDWQSTWQSDAIPIPQFAQVEHGFSLPGPFISESACLLLSDCRLGFLC